MCNTKEPKILYHYCSLETFAKIIATKTLRFSDITKSNDSDEIVYLWNQYEKYIKKTCEPQQHSFMKYIINAEIENKQHFALCFTELADSPYFWNCYANGGVAIGFNFKKLKEWAENSIKQYVANIEWENNGVNPCHLSRVEYHCKSAIDKDLENIFKSINASTGIAGEIPFLCPFVKNDYFEAEQEWRIAFTIETDKNKMLTLWSSNGTNKKISVPLLFTQANKARMYYDVLFDSEIIENIVLSSNSAINEKNIYCFMNGNGINISQENILRSKGSLN